MARIRQIKPEFFDDPDIGDLTLGARLLFVGLWTQADREGRLVEDERRIKARILPFDRAPVKPILDELVKAGMVIRYAVDGRKYLQIRSFLKHQRPHFNEVPSTLPPCLNNLGRAVDAHENNQGSAREQPRQCASTTKDTRATPGSGSLVLGAGVLGTGAGVLEDGEGGTGADDDGPSEADLPPVETAAPDGAPPSPSPAAELRDAWNDLTTPPIPRCLELNADRKRKIAARLQERPLESWREVFRRIEQSAFCRGENDRGWRASFDWIVHNAENATKVLEGKYDGSPRPLNGSRQAERTKRNEAERLRYLEQYGVRP